VARAWPGGVTQLVLDPVDFLGRLAHLLRPEATPGKTICLSSDQPVRILWPQHNGVDIADAVAARAYIAVVISR
jgi:hypothetical protein